MFRLANLPKFSKTWGSQGAPPASAMPCALQSASSPSPAHVRAPQLQTSREKLFVHAWTSETARLGGLLGVRGVYGEYSFADC